MSKTILILSSDIPLLPSRPVTGVGLRIHGLAEGLKGRGYRVVHAISSKRLYYERGIPEELRQYSYLPGNLEEIIKRVSPDIILKSWWGIEDRQLESISIPIIFDLPAPRIIEEVYHGRSPTTMCIDKIHSLKAGDLFICSTRIHRAYYLPYLIMSGMDIREDIIRVVPHSTVIFPHVRPRKELRFVYGGVFWAWQNPVRSLNILINLIERYNRGSLSIYGGTIPYHDNDVRHYLSPISHLTPSSRVTISGLLPYERMREEFSRASVAIDVMDGNREREMSFSFRVLDYLSCGLPVITNKDCEWGRMIEEYRAGWVVDPEDEDEIEYTIESIFNSPEVIEEYSRNAIRLIGERFSHETAIMPLIQFCKDPVKRRKGRDIITYILNRREGDESLEELEEFVKGEDTPPDIHIKKGMILIREKKFREAERELEIEEGLYPARAETRLAFGILYREEKRYADALKRFKEAIDLNPFLEWVHLNTGITYGRMERYREAERELEIEEWLYPAKPETAQGRGVIFRLQGRCDDAIREFKSAITISPYFDEAYLEMGITYLKMDNLDKALEGFSTAFNLNPSNMMALYNLSSLMESMERYDEALEGFLKVGSCPSLSISLKGGAYFHIGRLYYQSGDIDTALSYFKRCLELIPEHREALQYIRR